MGNKQIEDLGHLASEWEMQQCQGIICYKNLITNQEFQLQELKHHSNNDLAIYLQRSIYPLPNTPKIMILDQLEKGKDTTILVQKLTQKAEDFIPKLTYQLQILQNIQQCCRVAENIFKRYGEYYLNQRMLGFDAQGKILLWFNQSYKQNRPQILFQNTKGNKQRALILQIIDIYQKYCKYDLKDMLVIPLPNLFAEFQIKLQKLILKEKEKLSKIRNQDIKQIKYSSKPVSPKKQYYKVAFKSPKKYKIPKFVSQLQKKIESEKNTELITTKIPRLLKNKEQFLNFSLEKDNNQKVTSSGKVTKIIDKTIKLDDLRFLRQEAGFATDYNKINLAQTVHRNQINRNCRLDQRMRQQQNCLTSEKLCTDEDKQPWKKHYRAKPISLAQLCSKFKESQFVQDSEQCISAQSLKLQEKMSYTFDESRPMTFKHEQMKEQSYLSWQEQIAQLIN